MVQQREPVDPDLETAYRLDLHPLSEAADYPVAGGEGRRLPVEGGHLVVKVTVVGHDDPDDQRALIEEYIATTSVGASIVECQDAPERRDDDADEDGEVEDPEIPGLQIDLGIEPEACRADDYLVSLAVDPPIAVDVEINAAGRHFYVAGDVYQPLVRVRGGNLEGFLAHWRKRQGRWRRVGMDTTGNIRIKSRRTGSHRLRLEATARTNYTFWGSGFVRWPCG